jgi:FkbM family methyltransferase
MADRRLINECIGNPTMWPAASLFALRRWLGQEEIKVRRQGVTLSVGAQSGQGAWQGIAGLDYEPELRQILSRVKPGDVIMDIGANIGSYTLRLARKTGATGRVIAVEAMEGNAVLLRRNLEINNIANVTVIPFAIGATQTRVALYSKGHSSSTRLKEGDNFSQVGETEMTTGDRVVEQLQISHIDWIKMDIEGGEPDALRGMTQTIKNSRPRILFENGPGAKETIGLLREVGYIIGYFDSEDHFIEASESSSLGNLFALPLEKLGEVATESK